MDTTEEHVSPEVKADEDAEALEGEALRSSL